MNYYPSNPLALPLHPASSPEAAEMLWDFTEEFEHLIPVGSTLILPGPHDLIWIH